MAGSNLEGLPKECLCCAGQIQTHHNARALWLSRKRLMGRPHGLIDQGEEQLR